ncbi:MAG: hypothetical protein WB774_11350, partial [Xanthobacteraceae bacterium]
SRKSRKPKPWPDQMCEGICTLPCAAYWTQILVSYAKRYILKAHNYPLHSTSFGKRPKDPRLGPINWLTYVSRDLLRRTDFIHGAQQTTV